MSIEAVGDDFSWGFGSALEVGKRAFVRALPLVSLLETAVSGLSYFYAAQLFDEPLDDPDADTFRVKREEVEKLADLLVERRIEIFGAEGGVKKAVQDVFKRTFVEALDSSSEIVQELNRKNGMQAALFVDISEEEMETMSPYRVQGREVLVYEIPKVKVQLPEGLTQEQAEGLKVSGYPLEQRRFLIAHEFSHIRHNDNRSSLITRTLAAAISTLFWVNMGMNLPLMLWPYAVCLGGLPLMFVLHALIETGLLLEGRSYERRADREAIEELGTNQGAVEYFSKADVKRDYNHPRPQERLALAKKWVQNPV